MRYKQIAIRRPQKQIVLRWFLKSPVSLLAPQKALSPSGERAFCFSRSDGIRTARSRHSGTQTVQWTVCEGAGESAPVCRIELFGRCRGKTVRGKLSARQPAKPLTHLFKAILHNSKCRYGERGTAAAKPKAQIILCVLSSILATQMPCRSRRSGA